MLWSIAAWAAPLPKVAGKNEGLETLHTDLGSRFNKTRAVAEPAEADKAAQPA